MKKVHVYYFLSFYYALLLVSCTYGESGIKAHKGDNLSNEDGLKISIDSITINAFYTSSQGNFFMIDSVITFADAYYAKMHHYNCQNGELIESHFGLGEGENEMDRFLYAFPIINDTSVFLLILI